MAEVVEACTGTAGSVAIDHRRAPLLDGIRRYHALDVWPYSTPGHKLGVGADPVPVLRVGRRHPPRGRGRRASTAG